MWKEFRNITAAFLSLSMLCQLYGQIRFEYPVIFGSNDGLQSAGITALLEDHHGFIWIGTSDGLHRYNGEVIEYLPTLLNRDELRNSVSFLYQTTDGNIWISGTGLCELDPKTYQLKCYSNNPDDSLSIGPGIINGLLEDQDGKLWIASIRNGLMYLDRQSEKFYCYKPEDNSQTKENSLKNLHIKSILQDRNNSDLLWLTGRNGLLSFSKDQRIFKRITFDDVLKSDLTNLFQDPDGSLLIGSYGGLIKYEPLTESWELYIDRSNIAAGYNIIDIKPKTNNELWILNALKGPAIFDKLQSRFQFFSVPNQYATPFFNTSWRCILITRGNVLWAGSRAGLYKIDPFHNQFHNIDLTELSVNNQNSDYPTKVFMGVDSNYLIASSLEKSFMVFDKDFNFVKRMQLNKQGFSDGFDCLTVDDKQDVWLVSDRQIYRYHQDSGILESCLIDNEEQQYLQAAMDIELDITGNLWIGTQRNGLFHYNPAKRQLTRFFESGSVPDSVYLRFEYISDLLLDFEGKIWFCGNWGISCIDPETFEIESYGSTSSRGICQLQDSSIWVTTHGDGLWQLKKKNGQWKIDSRLTVKDGLPTDVLFRVTSDGRGGLWFTHTKGVSRMDLTPNVFRHFDYLDGLPRNISAEGPFETLNDGIIAISYENYLTFIDPDHILVNTTSPEVFITSVKVFNKKKEFDKDVKYLSSIELNHKDNFFSIEFVSNNLSMSSRNRYSYMLEGFDDSWQDCGHCTSAQFTNVPPDKYFFKVRSVNNDGVWSDTDTTLEIYIKPAYWQTSWFKGLLILILIGIIFSIYKIRIRYLTEKEEFNRKLGELELKALRSQMNPHFLFNSLNSIKRFIIKNEPNLAADYLNTFSNLIRQILNNSRSALVKLEEELNALRLYLELESLRFSGKFQYEIHCDPKISTDEIMIPPMIVQPYVENAIWHGLMHKDSDGKLNIRLTQVQKESKKYLMCTIEDNGIGRQRAAELKSKSSLERKSMGMEVTSTRLELMKKMQGMEGDVAIEDLTDNNGNSAGTRVTIQMAI